jgi:hypothetical protein
MDVCTHHFSIWETEAVTSMPHSHNLGRTVSGISRVKWSRVTVQKKLLLIKRWHFEGRKLLILTCSQGKFTKGLIELIFKDNISMYSAVL